jgi:hypothetical protein
MLTEFLQQVRDEYLESYNPITRSQTVEAELTELRGKIASLENELACLPSLTDVEKTLIDAEELIGTNASEEVLMRVLIAKFGGEKKEAAPKKRAPKRTVSPVTDAEKNMVLRLMTKEPISPKELAALATEDDGENKWLASDLSPILKAMLADGTVHAEGHGRGRRYNLTDKAVIPD